MKKKFAITGVAGYIAPRHLKAIKDTGNELVAALDPHDAVGVLDNYFPKADFFIEPERFDRHLEKLKRTANGIDFLSICSPNYLHDAHIRMALRIGADAICEKPLVLNPKNLDLLAEIEHETHQKIYTVLQLRVHPVIIDLKNKYQNTTKKHQIDLIYITSRGNWYDYSWKGNLERSGGIASNIGIHFFDMLIWIFGKAKNVEIEKSTPHTICGKLELKNANVNWFLSIDYNELPENIKLLNQKTYRNISIDGSQIEFSDGFADLHTKVYSEILNGNGYGISDARSAIELVSKLRK
ncbi:MAG: gfo/Idh/MocA family oxidoreductase [Bacteroidetes bacterium]|nr:MAG: gfo/Idh/MocA family oxidoreductase [Bacteroidota bacterium]